MKITKSPMLLFNMLKTKANRPRIYSVMVYHGTKFDHSYITASNLEIDDFASSLIDYKTSHYIYNVVQEVKPTWKNLFMFLRHILSLGYVPFVIDHLTNTNPVFFNEHLFRFSYTTYSDDDIDYEYRYTVGGKPCEGRYPWLSIGGIIKELNESRQYHRFSYFNYKVNTLNYFNNFS